MIEYTRCPKCGTLFDVSDIDLSDSEGWVQCGECTHQFDATQQAVERSDLLGKSILANMDDINASKDPQQDFQEGTFNLDQLALDHTMSTQMNTPSMDASEMIDLFDGNPPSFVDQEYAHPIDDDAGSTEIIAHSVEEYYQERSISVEQPDPQVASSSKDDSEKSDGFIRLEKTLDQDTADVVFAEKDLMNDAVNQRFDDLSSGMIADVHDGNLPDLDSQLLTESLDASVSVVDADVYASLQTSRTSGWLRALLLIMILPVLLVFATMLAFQLQQRQIVHVIPDHYHDLLGERWLAFLDRGQAPKVDLSKIHLSSTRMEPHATRAGAITIVLQLINRADMNQAYPSLEVAFTDESGKVIARKNIESYQYLGKTQLNLLENKQAKTLRLHFASLPTGAVGYEIKITQQHSS